MKKLIILFLCTVSLATAQQKTAAAEVVQKQVEAYNARNIEAFIATYSDDVVFYGFPKEVRFKGIAQVREIFGIFFKNSPDLHCDIEDRIASGDTVIDHEKVRFQKDDPIQEFVVMYKVTDGKIQEVYFLKRP
ncbi:nuclear transport factor 2 family protein [Kordia sp.]|uniref:nuclear transport factor 2 family protein n=1 Tax=Kordia sp. TaxID=1965332 RepID=UPI003B5C088E